jgi:hypothetical protein
MNRDLMWCLSSLLLCSGMTTSYASAVEGPYQAIAKRNAFNLQPPQEQRSPETPSPLPKFRLTGIINGFVGKRAFLKMQVADRPGELIDDQLFALRPGERKGEIEVLGVDEKLGSVRIDVGRPLTLKFEEEETSQRSRVTLPAVSTPQPVPQPSMILR